ncbi:protein FAM53A-like [Diadema antillarum]|uniref:protein FAM53A-like n=1 Tax=Diadema antillarum TaxID=105358 RepID=UPI003A8B5E56
MVTLITEQLQNQSLEDVSFLPKIPFQYQTRSRTRALQQTLQDALSDNVLQGLSHTATKHSFFSNLYVQSSTTITTTTVSRTETSLSSSTTTRSIPVNEVEHIHNAMNETLSTTPPAPPKKRHCRSLSAGEVTSGRSLWKPNASKIWRPISPCRANLDTYQGHAPMLNASGNANFADAPIPSTTLNLAGDSSDAMNQYSTPPESPIPRPASATSWENSTNPPVWLEQTSFKPLTSSPRLWHRLRSLEDAEKEGLSASSGSVASITSSVDSAPETDLNSSGGFARGTFRKGRIMPRCRSQPCVSDRKACGKKRRREEEQRPKLDLFKMREESRGCLSHQSASHTKLESKVELARPRRPGCHKYQNKKHLRSMGMTTYSPEEFVGLTTIASSPCENNNLPPPVTFLPTSSSSSSSSKTSTSQEQQSSVMITPTSSPTKEMMECEGEGRLRRRDDINENICSYCSDDDHQDDEDEEEEESDADTMVEKGERFILDPCNELDLEQIEKF